MKYTINQFRKDFPDDKTCLSHIFKNRYPNGLECPKCHRKEFYPVDNRRAYACSCGYQTSPTEGTIFHKSPTPLTAWFYAIYLMSQSKNGVSAMELQRQLGVTYKCAWRMAKQIRKLMIGGSDRLGGIVEIDETYIGGKIRVGSTGPKLANKTPVVGAVERHGRVRTKVLKEANKETLLPFVEKTVRKDAQVMTDSLYAYRNLPDMGYDHAHVDHTGREYARGNVSTNTIEGFWSQLKRSINGTYHSVSKKHLQAYVDEFAFRYNHRGDVLPPVLLAKVGMHA